jgi:hypothetical protein
MRFVLVDKKEANEDSVIGPGPGNGTAITAPRTMEEKKDRCYRLAKQKYDVFPSAYASGFIVRCRQGKVAKKKNEEVSEGTFDKEKSKGLHGWFQRQGGKGKSKGWVDCNTCRTNPETGRKTCKSCGRQSGEERSKYPACRPTPSACNKTGTKNKKSSKRTSWKKKISEGTTMRFVLKERECSMEEVTEELEEGGAYTEEGQSACEACVYETISQLSESPLEEAEYRGRKVPLGKPMRGDVKKFKVFVKDPKTDNVKKVNFGDKKMRIKKSNPKRRKSFRARHNCANPGPRTKARYWSCRKW